MIFEQLPSELTKIALAGIRIEATWKSGWVIATGSAFDWLNSPFARLVVDPMRVVAVGAVIPLR